MKNKIEELRNTKGLTQEDFANLMEVSRQTISSLENGKYNPSIFLAYKISKFFNLKIEDVFIFEETSNKNLTSERKIWNQTNNNSYYT